VDVAELTARDDVKRWTLSVRTIVTEFSQFACPRALPAGPPSEAQQAINIRAAHAADRIWGDAAHWYKAIAGEGLPPDVRQAIEASLDTDVRQTVRHMRNITEHWGENRRRLERQDFRGARESILWYRDMNLVNGPWSWTWTIDQGFELGQVLRLDRLLADLSKVEAILAGVVN
jgi:hypothetical protein